MLVYFPESINIWLREAKESICLKGHPGRNILETCKLQDTHVFEEILINNIELSNTLASGPDQNETNSSGGLWKQNNGRHCFKIGKNKGGLSNCQFHVSIKICRYL